MLLIGRAEEMATLRGLVEQMQDGTSRACVITGAAGLGKSALVNNLVGELRESPDKNNVPRVLFAQSSSVMGSRPLYTARQFLRRWERAAGACKVGTVCTP